MTPKKDKKEKIDLEYRPKFWEIERAKKFDKEMEDVEFRKANGMLEPIESILIRKGKFHLL